MTSKSSAALLAASLVGRSCSKRCLVVFVWKQREVVLGLFVEVSSLLEMMLVEERTEDSLSVLFRSVWLAAAVLFDDSSSSCVSSVE